MQDKRLDAIFAFAKLNFTLQRQLREDKPPTDWPASLKQLGFEDSAPASVLQLFGHEAFLGPVQTGKRIANFTLKTAGIEPEAFEAAEKSICDAYCVFAHLHDPLLQKSFEQTMAILAVFRP